MHYYCNVCDKEVKTKLKKHIVCGKQVRTHTIDKLKTSGKIRKFYNYANKHNKKYEF